MAIPASIAFSPEDRLVTFLFAADGGLERQLYAVDTDSGERHLLVAPPGGGVSEERLALEEKLRRERQRQLGLGVTSYAWASDADRLLVPLPEGLYVKDGAQGELRMVLDAATGPVVDPQLSPDGTEVAFVRHAEVHVVPVTGGRPRQVTSGARDTGRTNGLAEFVAQEEMGRSSGFWWSPDGAWLAFTEVDESDIPAYRIVHQGVEAPDTYEEHRYPFAGGPNAKVRLGVIPASGGDPRWLAVAEHDEVYLARVGWMPDGTVVAQVQDRGQTTLDLLRFDPGTGRRQHLLRETSELWVNLHDLFHPLEQGTGSLEGGFVWGSERTGFRHLYLCAADGAVVRPLTGGAWMVDSLDGVDEEAGLVYFSATLDGPTERHLYAAPLAGGEPRRVTTAPGTHAVVVDHDCRRFVDVHSAVHRQPTVTLRSLGDGGTLHVLHDEPDPRVTRLGLRPPELVSLPTRDGETLHGAVYRPEPAGPAPPPAVVSVYGGPQVQRVTDAWSLTADMRAQHLSGLGFVVLVVDNRGSARRGHAFEAAVHRRLGTVEVDDQVDGVRWLVAQGLADPARVGIYGWSYGGYLAALCLAKAPGEFRAAVAGAPVTSWDGYDTHYTERYMGTPSSNPEGYETSSVTHHVGTMTGSLLLVHGLLDENVHFRHTARLLGALIRAGKPYQLLVFPDERHVPRRVEDRAYMEERLRDFFVERL